eukprot:1146889-Pelagomonas_calceolata.AAC.1
MQAKKAVCIKEKFPNCQANHDLTIRSIISCAGYSLQQWKRRKYAPDQEESTEIQEPSKSLRI